MPHQEIYLALLDQQASAAMAQIEDLLNDSDKSTAAKQRAEDNRHRQSMPQFYDRRKGCYAFSRNGERWHVSTASHDGVYPALAWW